ncbi:MULTISPECIES: Coenzyme F420 hydrogenase/dehydrogenase, beta subunit C-terminal domain [Cyanophyceae]|uniref:Coenzyme F420 hydrogenase/dehydrogenase, beta subunit C-terminal domain n=2 Tax=Cyanobacteriota TaxID=1117 RepID=UPI002330F902|nr:MULTISPECIES: Coenzyme F420 hydrogenase/dehydrogenase, beta subunit C-terminal domain [Cyanophyceae]MDB9357231.1 Coenzyme F420 hydrogenase/dehydrogenase, beta subunit C-terminal domain [Nodularia spumigena CS-587/03]MDB9318087.1 Coenzyme F420 hydrogenase/dehydrogenase, beta subunit C-terminal domain [Nodularia spumigena CS-590/01A]MDB9323333.1 Coenzyme F420 hydrogenase/dehydrogenase, beta subunit C-terminal domain [Nodularia spumigena CS-591/07A]MDB9326859.1 Coenzyme F420 hydrogenase/dehydro
MSNLKSVTLFNTVVENGYCIGCGACASLNNSPLEIKLNNYGVYQATLKPLADSSNINYSLLEKVCPFSASSLNEDQISEKLYAQECNYNPKIGYYYKTFAGYVKEGEFRNKGSSGGVATWILSRLLEKKLVDYVIHIQSQSPSENDSRLFKYSISSTKEEAISGAKTRYYPVEMSEVLKIIQKQSGRYAIIGVPCFIKAVRLLMNQDEILRERIRFCIGLICGHLKSTQFAEMFAWQLGIEPGTIEKIDFRKKLPETSASSYGVEVTGKENNQLTTKVTPPVNQIFGTNWGLGLFKYKACDYCDDITAETADLTVGDAWLPQYVQDYKGTNIVVVRNIVLAEILEEGVKSKSLYLEKISPQDVIESQNANYRHRRTGLAYRLYVAQKKGEWYPIKRVKPSKLMTASIRRRFLLRMEIAEKSHIFFQEALQHKDYSFFLENMLPLIQFYDITYHTSLWLKILGKFKSLVKTVLQSLILK